MKRHPLTTVIVNWNAGDHLLRCLESVPAAVGDRPHQVVVVDHASSDGSPQRVRQGFPAVTLLACEDNPGFGAGVRRGVAAADPDARWLAVVNPDVVLPPASLDRLVTFLEERPEAGLVGPTLRSPAGTLESGAEPVPGITSALADVPLLARLYRPWAARRQPAEPTPCGRVRGALMVFRRQALEAIGGFPDDTFLYGEEILVGHRLARAGWRVWYHPGIEAIHAHGKSTEHRWSPREVVLERRRARLRVMAEVLSPTAFRWWNRVARWGLELQAAVGRGDRALARDLAALHRDPHRHKAPATVDGEMP